MFIGLTVEADWALRPLASRPKPVVILVSCLSLVIRLFLRISFFVFLLVVETTSVTRNFNSGVAAGRFWLFVLTDDLHPRPGACEGQKGIQNGLSEFFVISIVR